MAAVRFLLLHVPVLLSLLLTLHMPSSSSLKAKRSNRRCIASERDALLSWKASLSDPEDQLSSWKGEDCCQWKGVHCSNKTNHIIKLDLRGKNFYCNGFSDSFYGLGGEMRSSLVRLHHLSYLDLSCNNFSRIPKFIGSLKGLKYLNVSLSSDFPGRVPSQLGNLSKLVYLDLSSSYLDSLGSDNLAWVSRLSSLKYLDLSNRNLSAAVDWIHAISSLPSLEFLYLTGCDLRNTIANVGHSNLTALNELDMGHNSFCTAISPNWFWHITTLTYLDLSSCGFQGQIPYEMGNMTSLEQVYIDENNITSMIPPPDLKNLCNLKILDLHHSGNIAWDIGALMQRLPKCSWDKLHWLDLSYNKIGGNLPNWSPPLMSLSYLNFYGNDITGPLPLWIGGLNNLTVLNLGSNRLVGEINEEHLEGLRNLQVLQMSGNSLSFVVRSNWNPSFKLEVVSLRSCKIGPAFPAWIRWQRTINVLDISNATINGSIPSWFWTVLSTASFLDMSKNLLIGTLPRNLENLAAHMIDLSSNRFTGPVPRYPGNITYLDLSRNNLSGTLPDFGAMSLYIFALYNNSISGNIPPSLCLVRSLYILDLSANMLSGEVPTCKVDSDPFKYMAALNLNTNNLSGDFPSALRRSQELVFLDLAYNRFSGNLPAWLADKLPSLALLRLRSNNFSGNIPIQLAMIQELQYIDLACNGFSGQIPESIWNLSAMANSYVDSFSLEVLEGGLQIGASEPNIVEQGTFNDMIYFTVTMSVFTTLTKGQQLEFSEGIEYMVNIDLSCNNLTGEIPQGISALVALKSLNFSWNHLSGRIPNNIGDLKALESLDLSHNELSGEIPSGISTLTSLSSFNLSYNNLSGRIPTGNQLQTLAIDDPTSMYVGNIGLCGPPLPKGCPGNGTSHSPADEPEQQDNGMVNSIYLSMIIGFIFGLWMVFCIMLLHKGLRYSYFFFIDDMYQKVCVHMIVTWNLLVRR